MTSVYLITRWPARSPAWPSRTSCSRTRALLCLATQASQHGPAGEQLVQRSGLLSIIWGCVRLDREPCPFAVGAYVAAAYSVYVDEVVRQPGCDPRASGQRYIRRDSTIDAPGFIVAQLLERRRRRRSFDGSCRRCRAMPPRHRSRARRPAGRRALMKRLLVQLHATARQHARRSSSSILRPRCTRDLAPEIERPDRAAKSR